MNLKKNTPQETHNSPPDHDNENHEFNILQKKIQMLKLYKIKTIIIKMQTFF